MPRTVLTETPKNIVTDTDAGPLIDGSTYIIQAITNEAGDSPVFLAESTAAPTEPDLLLQHFEKLQITVATATPLWAWVPEGQKNGVLLVGRGN